MKNSQKGFAIPILIAVVALLVFGGGFVYYKSNNVKTIPVSRIPDVVSNLPTSTPKNNISTTSVNSWKTYTNTQYGFSIQYPAGYSPTEDISGWPHSVILFSGPGGQSYYLVIEVWNNISEFDSARGYKVPNPPVVKKIGNQYITLWNVNQDPKVDDIISTFKLVTPVVVCTADAKQCPDGSYVGRSGPKCEFVCPSINKPNINNTIPSIKILSPNGGEIIKIGERYQILWNSSNIGNDYVNLLLDDGSANISSAVECTGPYGIELISNSTSGSYDWNTNNNVACSFGPGSRSIIPGSKYKIKVCHGDVCGLSDNYFTISN